jgi:hypothetical protein
MDGIKLIGYICGAEERTPETVKIIKIIKWPSCRSISEACAFIGICVYYQLWIKGFAKVAAPIYTLIQKNILFI